MIASSLVELYFAYQERKQAIVRITTTKNAIALEKLKTEFKGKVEILPLPAPVLRDLKKLAADVVKEESEKSPMARKVSPPTRSSRCSAAWSHISGRRVPAVRGAVRGERRGGPPWPRCSWSARSRPRLTGPPAVPHRGAHEVFGSDTPDRRGAHRSGSARRASRKGGDVSFDILFTEGDAQATRAAAAALVKGGVDLILTSDEGPTQAAKDATKRPDRLHARR